ncbi:MAG: hypothetical protein ACREFD_15625 [Stellaceae bacterium]
MRGLVIPPHRREEIVDRHRFAGSPEIAVAGIDIDDDALGIDPVGKGIERYVARRFFKILFSRRTAFATHGGRILYTAFSVRSCRCTALLPNEPRAQSTRLKKSRCRIQLPHPVTASSSRQFSGISPANLIAVH